MTKIQIRKAIETIVEAVSTLEDSYQEVFAKGGVANERK